MAKTNNLSDFLTDVANAIRIRRGYESVEQEADTFADISSLIEAKTGYPVSSNGSEYGYCKYAIDNGLGHTLVFWVYNNTYYKRTNLCILYGFNTSDWGHEDFNLSDIEIIYEKSGTSYVYNVYNRCQSGRDIKMSFSSYSLSSGQWYKSDSGGAIPFGPGECGTISNCGDITVNPFINIIEIPHVIAAQDFYDEIVGIPYGQEDPDDYGEQVLDQSFQVHVTSGGDGEEPSEETRTAIKQFDFTDKNKIYIKWDGKNSGGPYGTCSGSVTIGTGGTTYQLYNFGTGDGGWGGLNKDQEFSVFDISALSGTQNVTFTVIADSAAGVSTTMWMEANINVKEIYLD